MKYILFVLLLIAFYFLGQTVLDTGLVESPTIVSVKNDSSMNTEVTEIKKDSLSPPLLPALDEQSLTKAVIEKVVSESDVAFEKPEETLLNESVVIEISDEEMLINEERIPKDIHLNVKWEPEIEATDLTARDVPVVDDSLVLLTNAVLDQLEKDAGIDVAPVVKRIFYTEEPNFEPGL